MVALVRAGYGLVLLIASNPLLRLVTGRPATATRRAVVRVLAARELLQALMMAAQPDATCLLLSAEVDVVHSVSMLGWAVIGNSRRLALTSGAAAVCFATAGVAHARRVSAAPQPASAGGVLAKLIELRNQVAAAVAACALPRAARSLLPSTAGAQDPGADNGLRQYGTARQGALS